MAEKETFFTSLAEEAEAYLNELIKEVKIESITGTAVRMFFLRYLWLRFKWFIEHALLIFLCIFVCIIIWKFDFGFEVRTIAKVLSSAGMVVVLNALSNSLQVKHLNDVVKMELKFLKRYQTQIKFKEEPNNGGGKEE